MNFQAAAINMSIHIGVDGGHSKEEISKQNLSLYERNKILNQHYIPSKEAVSQSTEPFLGPFRITLILLSTVHGAEP